MTMPITGNTEARTTAQLLAAVTWAPEERLGGAQLMCFDAPGMDVYNATPPFTHGKTTLIAGRVEKRGDEAYTETRFFDQNPHGVWVPRADLPTLPLQDPFIAKVCGRLVVGGVRVTPREDAPGSVDTWATELYVGDGLHNLKLLVRGPDRMKDVRLVQLEQGIGVFTRPQGDKGGRGKIGFAVVRSLEDITPELLHNAPLIPGIFADDEWGGVNEAHPLEDGRIGVVGHIARYVGDNEGVREYHAMTFIFNPDDFSISSQQIVATRDCFPATAAKRPELTGIVFPGGMHLVGEYAVLYSGLSDTSVGMLAIPNPFHSR